MRDLKIVLNANKSKLMLFSNTKTMSKPQLLLLIITFQGFQIEAVSQYKYLGFIMNNLWPLFPTSKADKKFEVKFFFFFLN